jgi:hypothetical protein
MAITDYDRQAVIWCAQISELNEFLDRAEALNGKAKIKAAAASHTLALESAAMFPGMGEADDEALASMLGRLTDKSRLYISAHGAFGEVPKVVCWDAPTFVGILKKNGLRRAKLINLVACEMGRDYSDELENYIITSAPPNSFAAQFHRELKTQEPELLTEVRAYTWFTGEIIRKDANMPADLKPFPIGTKLKTASEVQPHKWVHKPKDCKISFFWDNGKQRRRYMNPDGNKAIDDPL